MSKKDPNKKKPEDDDELGIDQDMLQSKADIVKKELSEKRSQLDLLLKSLPEVKPSPESSDYEAYLRIEKQTEQLKKAIAQKQKELMELLKNQNDLDLKEEEEL